MSSKVVALEIQSVKCRRVFVKFIMELIFLFSLKLSSFFSTRFVDDIVFSSRSKPYLFKLSRCLLNLHIAKTINKE